MQVQYLTKRALSTAYTSPHYTHAVTGEQQAIQLLTSTDRRHHGLQAAVHHAYSLVTSWCIYNAPALDGHFEIAPFVRLSVGWRSWLGYRHAGCLQLSHRRPPYNSILRHWLTPLFQILIYSSVDHNVPILQISPLTHLHHDIYLCRLDNYAQLKLVNSYKLRRTKRLTSPISCMLLQFWYHHYHAQQNIQNYLRGVSYVVRGFV